MLIVALCVLMIMVNLGGKYITYVLRRCLYLMLTPYSWRSNIRNHKYAFGDLLPSLLLKHADYTQNAIVPSLRWEGFNGSSSVSPSSRAELEIQGELGSFLAIW